VTKLKDSDEGQTKIKVKSSIANAVDLKVEFESSSI